MEVPPANIPGVPAGGSSSDLPAQVYQQLRLIAGARLAAQKPGHTLQATALVHEAYLKLQHHPSLFAAEKGHFYGVAAEAMRQILIDHARGRARQKRGGGQKRRAVADVAELAAEQNPDEIMALDEAVRRLEQVEPRAAEVVKLRFFAGLTFEEIAEVTRLSLRTVKREWTFARAWLYRALE